MHAFKKGTDAASGRIRNGPVVGDGEGEFFVLGADAELIFRLAARLKPGDQFVAGLDWSHIDLVTSHAKFRRREGRDVKHAALQRAMRLIPEAWRNSAVDLFTSRCSGPIDRNIIVYNHRNAGSHFVLFAARGLHY